MTVILNSNIVTAPGTYISEQTTGIIPAGLATFNRTYIMVTGGSGPFNTPTQVVSETDFTNVFGVSPSVNDVRAFFRNYNNGILFATRVGSPNVGGVLLGAAGAGAWTLTINGTAVTYTAGSSDTQAQIVTGLVNAINLATISPAVTAFAGTAGYLEIRANVIGDNLTIAATTTPTTAVVAGYSYTATVGGTVAQGNHTITINGTTVTFNAPASPAPSATNIAAGIAAAINANTTLAPLVTATAASAVVTITSNSTTLVRISAATAAGSGTITLAPVTSPIAHHQFIYSILNSFDPEFHSQGFLIAPEAFQTFSSQQHRLAIGTAMENLAASEGYDWMALIDSGDPTQIPTTARAQIEGQLYTTPRGHSAYFFPYLVTLENDQIPPSPVVAAIGLRRYADQGFNQPPAGGQYPCRGVTDVVLRTTKSQQAVLNPLGINLVRFFPNQGVLVYGSRTRSSNPYYRFINTRIILNVLTGTLRTAFNTLIFSAVDGQGVLFQRIRETAAAICYQLWDGGALFGATPEAAFAVICGRANNPALDLENGIVRCAVYVVPSPTMERLMIDVVRTPIDGVQIAIAGVETN